MMNRFAPGDGTGITRSAIGCVASVRNLCFGLLFTAATLLLVAPPTAAQGLVSLGVRGGIPLSDLVDRDEMSGVFSDTQLYTVGPTIALNLPAGFAIQGDALYKRFSFGRPAGFFQDFPAADTNGNSWEFPVMVKWTAPGRLAPFVNAGASFRNWSGIDQLGNFVIGQDFDEIDDRNNTGFVAGGGITLKLGGVHISPELRYTRWGTSQFAEGVRNLLNVNRNQAEFLVGITF